VITRFAPSPTGPLHLGHAYSAMLAYDMAMYEGGEFLLRIEDIDQSRCRPEWEAQIYDDLRWLGLWWPEPVMRQSERLDAYAQALLRDFPCLLYDCTCTRADIAIAMSAPQEGVSGPDGLVYPGTCRPEYAFEAHVGKHPDAALRLNMAEAVRSAPERRVGGYAYTFHETGHGPNGETGLITFTAAEALARIGDVVIARRGMGTSYHLSVVLDDAAQGVTHVVRGADLFEATKIHIILQNLLSLPTPTYHHHRLIRDDQGKRLAKRDDARAISTYRAEGATPQDIRRMVGL
jgi:glutamyl-Q tRNA(Asp) synthetase